MFVFGHILYYFEQKKQIEVYRCYEKIAEMFIYLLTRNKKIETREL